MIEEYEAGNNTCDDGHIVRSTVIGESEIDQKERIVNVKNQKNTSIPEKGDIIIENVFPGKDDDEVLFNPISRDLFKKYISYEGTLINHCSVNYNSDIKSNGNKIYTVIAIKDIPKDTEIVVNYDVLHKKYPFIAGSKEGYKLC